MGTFIHNEPTSLSILQEAKIPQTLLATLSKDIPASTDVVLSIPGAFGAICLNAPGLEMFKDFKLKSFFDLFTSESHVRAFQDSELASNLGMSVDELVRHQPSLRTSVMSEINTMLEGVLERCNVQNISAEDMDHCSLQKSRSSDAPPPGEATSEDSSKEDKKESLVPLLIEGAARVSPMLVSKCEPYMTVFTVLTMHCCFLYCSSARVFSRTRPVRRTS
jgi:E3 ubiquitin-protein ligase HUWE1